MNRPLPGRQAKAKYTAKCSPLLLSRGEHFVCLR